MLVEYRSKLGILSIHDALGKPKGLEKGVSWDNQPSDFTVVDNVVNRSFDVDPRAIFSFLNSSLSDKMNLNPKALS